MRDGLPSVTAARVAAYRLTFERHPFPSGDPAADELLAADVAAGLGDFEPSERMGRYLAARTRFFDRVVVGAIERGVAQLVVIGAGYSGRTTLIWAQSDGQPEFKRPGEAFQHGNRGGRSARLEPGHAGLGHPCPFRELPLGQPELFPSAAHRFGQLETQPGLLVSLSCRRTLHSGSPSLGQGGVPTR